MAKRKSHSDDLHNIGMLIIGFAVLSTVLIIITVIQMIITYWYISLPIIGCTGYMYLKYRITYQPTQKPDREIIETNETIKINNGTRKTYTKQIYDPTMQKPLHPLFDILKSLL